MRKTIVTLALGAGVLAAGLAGLGKAARAETAGLDTVPATALVQPAQFYGYHRGYYHHHWVRYHYWHHRHHWYHGR